jgi:5-methylcytosine-specific restriction enzyme A
MPSKDPKRPGREWYSTGRWKKFRLAYLAQHPICVMCEKVGRVEPATVVDHKFPHRGDPTRFWMGPFQAVCKPCHDGNKQAEDKRGYSKAIGLDGWPIDERHPANGRGGSGQ